MKSICISIFLIVSVALFSQDRINRPDYAFIKSSEGITKATGWSYNETEGKWIDYQNVINKKSGLITTPYMMSQTDRNIISLSTKTIDFEGKTYFIVVLHRHSGEYKYPEIKEDWMTYEKKTGYIYTAQEYSKLLNLADSVEIFTNQYVSVDNYVKKFDDNVFIANLIGEIQKPTKTTGLVFKVLKAKDGSIRFHTPWISHKRFPLDLSKEYFESTAEEFNKLIVK